MSNKKFNLKIAAIASFKPDNPSAHNTKISFTPRFFRLFNIPAHCLALSTSLI